MPAPLAGLSLRDLEYLIAVARHRHFGRAAQDCGVSQPALSAQIRKLEAFVGVAVFERTPRKVLLTREGEEIVRRAGVVVAEARALLESARSGAQPLAGPFRFGALPTLGPYLLPSVIGPLRRAFPHTRFEFVEDRSEGLLAALRDGGLDAALLCAHEGEPGVSFAHLFFERFFLVCPPESAATWPLRPGEPPLIVVEEGHCLHDQVLEACGPAAPLAARRASSLEMLRQMVAAGEGVSLMPELAARALDGVEGLTARAEIPDPGAGREVALATRASDPRAPHIAAIAELIRSLSQPA